MRGIDITQEELDHAAAFMRIPSGMDRMPELFVMEREQLLRILAWYGNIRAGGRPIGSGVFVVNGEDRPTLMEGMDSEPAPASTEPYLAGGNA